MSFNFTTHTWPAGSIVTLYRVAWDGAYKDVVEFESKEARGEYFSSLSSSSIELSKMSYCKFGQPIKVNIPFAEAYTYNYLTVTNKTETGKEETFYYFITDVSFSAPETSILNVQLDVFQTYLFDFSIGQMFIERSHLNMKEFHGKTPYSEDFLKLAQRYLTVPEGLNIGTDYRVADHSLLNLSLDNFVVIICSTVDLVADWGTLTDPNLKTADGQETDRIISGCNVYQMKLSLFEDFMDKVSKAPWVASGIISLTLFPNSLLTDGPECKLGGIDAMFLGETPDEGEFFKEFKYAVTKISTAIPYRYKNLYKFYTYPYNVIEINNFSGTSLMLKPEMMKSIDLRLKNISCATPGHQRIGFYVSEYGISENEDYQAETIVNNYIDGTNATRQSSLQAGYNHDMTIFMDSLPQISLVKDNYLQWIAQTQNSREYSYSQAGWTNEKANTSAQLNYNQSLQAMSTASQNQLLNMAVSGLSLGTNTAVGALAGGPVGAGIGAGVGLAGIAGNYLSFQNSQALQQDIASQNYNLAQWANQGDYQQSIASINANVQDMALTQPSQVAQSGGNGFNLSNGLFALEVRYKTLGQNQISIIGDFWTRFGYSVKEYVQDLDKLQVMKRYTYWKCQEVYLDCARATEGAKDAIRGIFTRGTTVWTNPNDIGKCDIYDNYL